MAYADSAIDYRWTIHSISTAQRRMTVTYDPADSADTTRPTVFQNFTIPYDDFTESDLTVIATSPEAARKVVAEWDQVIESETQNASFPEDSYVGYSSTGRYKVTSFGAFPDINPLTHKYASSTVEDSNSITTIVSTVALDSAEKQEKYTQLGFSKSTFWYEAKNNGIARSIVSSLGLNDSYSTYGFSALNFLSQGIFVMGDSVMNTLQTELGYNDSDFAAYLVSVDSNLLQSF